MIRTRNLPLDRRTASSSLSAMQLAGRALATACLTLSTLTLAFGLANQCLGQAPEEDGPSELLMRLPFDRLILVDDAIFEIEPISPRPIPDYDPRKDLEAQEPKGRGDTIEAREEAKKKAEENVDTLVIHLVRGEQRDFKVKRSSIKRVEYWEDMLLAEGDRLVVVKNFPKAFEYYLAVEARNPNWPGLADHVDRMLFEEGSWALAANDRAKALRLLRELYQRRPDFDGLGPKLAEAYSGEIEQAISQSAYAYGRRFLRELEQVTPDSTKIAGLKDRFKLRAREAADRATSAPAGLRVDLLAQSLRIWPDQEGTPERFADAFREAPTLEVGVIDVPRPLAPWINSPAAFRVTPLVYLPLLVDETDDALLGKKPGQLLDTLELGDLGRRIELRLRSGVTWSDGSRQVSVLDVVRALSDRAQPRSPAFNARWADLLERIESADGELVTIRLTRTPLSPTSWLTIPVGPAHAAWDGRVSTSNGQLPVGDGIYEFRSGSDRELLLEAKEREDPSAARSTSGGTATSADALPPPPRIARIREIRYADPTDAMVALDRGEISLLELIPPDRVESLRANPEYKVGEYRLPSLHRIAVDGRNELLKSRLLRRAIAYAIDRQTILEEVVLRRAIDGVNRPSDGPFAAGSYADSPDVPPFERNILLAKMLVVGARRELGQNRIKLTFEYPARPDVKAAIPRIVESLRNVGIEIEPVERSETELEQALGSGRRFDLAYRVSRCAEPIYEVGPMLCPGYDAPPGRQGLAALASPRIMQLLLQLEHAPEWATARDLVTQIDRECRDELPIIPLWQLRDNYAWRTRLRGPVETADHLYQNIERWEIDPWHARDP